MLADEVPDGGEPLPSGVATALRRALLDAGTAGPVQVDGLELAGVVGRTGLVARDPAPATGWWLGWVADGGPELALAVTVEGDDGSDAASLAGRLLRALGRLDLDADG